MMYIVERMKDGQRIRLGEYTDIQQASKVIDADAQISGPDVAYYVEREGE